MSCITKKEAFVLGYLYYLVSLPPSVGISHDRARCVSVESCTPAKSYRDAHSIALANGVISKKRKRQISEILSKIRPLSEISEEEELPLEKRAAWQSGYYYAYNGWLIPFMVDNDGGLFELRTSIGMAQAEFANLVGLSQTTIARVEIGQRTLSDATMERIRTIVAELLNAS